jgi:hypothetical protein
MCMHTRHGCPTVATALAFQNGAFSNGHFFTGKNSLKPKKGLLVVQIGVTMRHVSSDEAFVCCAGDHEASHTVSGGVENSLAPEGGPPVLLAAADAAPTPLSSQEQGIVLPCVSEAAVDSPNLAGPPLPVQPQGAPLTAECDGTADSATAAGWKERTTPQPAAWDSAGSAVTAREARDSQGPSAVAGGCHDGRTAENPEQKVSNDSAASETREKCQILCEAEDVPQNAPKDPVVAEAVDGGQMLQKVEDITQKALNDSTASGGAEAHEAGLSNSSSASASVAPQGAAFSEAARRPHTAGGLHHGHRAASAAMPVPQQRSSPSMIQGNFVISTGPKHGQIIGPEQMQASVERLYHGYSGSPPSPTDLCAAALPLLADVHGNDFDFPVR